MIHESPPRDPQLRGHLSEDLCLDLLAELLPADTRAAWLQHVGACPRCAALLADRSEERDHFADRAETVLAGLEASPVARAGEANRAAGPHVRNGIGQRLPRKEHWKARAATVAAGVAIAASIAVVVLGPRTQRPPSFLAAHLRMLPSGVPIVSLRDAPDATDVGSVKEGLDAYSRRDFARAIHRLSRGPVSPRWENVRLLYLGNALLWRGRHAEAWRVLEPIPSADVPEPWHREMRWSQWLSLQGSGARVRADSLLQVVRREDPEFDRRAAVVLEELGSGPAPSR